MRLSEPRQGGGSSTVSEIQACHEGVKRVSSERTLYSLRIRITWDMQIRHCGLLWGLAYAL